MCGLYSLTTAHEAIRQAFPSAWSWEVADVPSSQRIGPSAKSPHSASNHRLTVRNGPGGPAFVSMRWRYESRWMREKGVKVPINARAETIFSNGLFKYSARDRRCLAIVDGFYEPKGPKGPKREQYRFSFEDSRPFALGGIWISFRGEDDTFDGFAIVTTKPNSQVAEIHGRMPIILDDEQAWTAWLSGDQSDVAQLAAPIDRPSLRRERIA